MDQTRAAVTDGPSAWPGWGWALDPKDRGWSGSRGQFGGQEGQSLSWSPGQMSPCLPPNPTPEGPSALDPCLLKHLNQHGSVCSLGEGAMRKAAQWPVGTVGWGGRKGEKLQVNLNLTGVLISLIQMKPPKHWILFPLRF